MAVVRDHCHFLVRNQNGSSLRRLRPLAQGCVDERGQVRTPREIAEYPASARCRRGMGYSPRHPARCQLPPNVPRRGDLERDHGFGIGRLISPPSGQSHTGRARNGVHVVRAFVFGDGQGAATAHRQAYAQQELINGPVPYSNDTGPQLFSGYGASTWRRNVALVQSSTDIFAQLMPAEVDCGDLTPPPRPDLSRPAYRVDPDIVALLDELS
jgi:hypothetical protein